MTNENLYLEVTSIDSMGPAGVRVANGSHQALDSIVLATGSRITQFLYRQFLYRI